MARPDPASARLLAGAAVLSLAAVVIALVSQYGFGMEPCPWCVLERAIFIAIAIVALLGMALRGAGRRLFAGLGVLLALCGVAATLWQHFQASHSESCALTLADKIMSRTLHLDSLLPQVFEARASCADAAVSLLGISYDLWALGVFVVVGLMALSALRRRA
jgi:disulfide bond formation protein DsbB